MKTNPTSGIYLNEKKEIRIDFVINNIQFSASSKLDNGKKIVDFKNEIEVAIGQKLQGINIIQK
jgi:hypothetical protein